MNSRMSMRTPGLIVADNVVRDGAVAVASSDDLNVQAVRQYHALVGGEPRVTATVLQTVGVKGYDGLSLALVTADGFPNHVFRALVLPAAALQAACWCLCRAWLEGSDVAPSGRVRALPRIGLVAAVFLVLHGTVLSTEGDLYRWMRRYGVEFHFGATSLAMLLTTGALLGSRSGAPGHRCVACWHSRAAQRTT